jgi:hypothetical protein
MLLCRCKHLADSSGSCIPRADRVVFGSLSRGRPSENSVKAKFAESLFHDIRE